MLKIPIIIGIIFFCLIACKLNEEQENTLKARSIDLTQYSSEKPKHPVHLLFIHHSTGGALLADKGEKDGPLAQYRIFTTHPNGGGLRTLLEKNNYIVHEASYGSTIGEETDICHWNRKFREHMADILNTDRQDNKFADGSKNKIIIFKSCFPNSWMTSDGKEPGNPDYCEKTTANYKAAYMALLGYFSKQPETLFVIFTAPPMAKPFLSRKEKVIDIIKDIFGKPNSLEKIGDRVRSFNNWLKDVKNGWLKGYELSNVIVFDYYDVLTDYGKSNWSAYPTQAGRDSHPSSQGNEMAARDFVPILNRAVNRIGF